MQEEYLLEKMVKGKTDKEKEIELMQTNKDNRYALQMQDITVEFPGVLYRGGAEQKIRKYLVDNNFVDTVIQLPANLFFGVSIATCIIVLKKSKKDNSTLFIDASNEFVHEGNKNKLSDANIARILNAFIERKDENHFSKLVQNGNIAENEYNILPN